MRIFLTICYLILLNNMVTGQPGKIVLVGGGTENRDAWSDLPYQWAVDQSANKKVAIISYDPGGEPEWLPDYFLDLGAAAALNFRIDSRARANDAQLMEQIKEYDVLFFKGGDQSQYYEYYLNTKLDTLVEEKYNSGGVIAGTSAGAAIIAGIAYTAENGTVYPDQVLQNVNHPDITLKDDFLDILPGIIVDTHFIERGRQARLMGFMAHWYINEGEMPVGIGIDDRTAFCIDADMMGTTFGTGAVSIYTAGHFPSTSGKLITDSIQAVQLLHTYQYDLNQKEVVKGPDSVTGQPDQENSNYQVFLHSDLDPVPGFWQDFFYDQEQDSMVIISASAQGASGLMDQVENINLVKATLILTSEDYNHPDSARLRNSIRRSKYIGFVNNDFNQLKEFLQAGPTGSLLSGHIKRNNVVVGFWGEDCQLAGDSYAANIYQDSYALYDGTLKYESGLRLLTNSIIMHDTYSGTTTDYYENKTGAVLYKMVKDSLGYGIYLNRKSYLALDQQADINILRAEGTFPVLVACQKKGQTELNQNPGRRGNIRMVTGFTNFQYASVSGNKTIEVGHPKALDQQPYQFEKEPLTTGLRSPQNGQYPKIFQNLQNKSCRIEWPGQSFKLKIFNIQGKTLGNISSDQQGQVNLSQLPTGNYIITVLPEKSFQSHSYRLCIP